MLHQNRYPRTRIKICGLTREQDLDAAAHAGVDAVGFVLYQASPRYVPLARAGELARRLPPFITPVLLFVNAPLAYIRQACACIPQAMVQLHGDETPQDCAQIERPFVRAARIEPPQQQARAGRPIFNLVEYAQAFQGAQAILLDTHSEGFGGSGKTFDWSELPQTIPAHLILSGGLTPANVGDGIVQVRARGKSLAVDVSSGVEISKGIKDALKIQQFVEAVRAADRGI